MPQFRLSSADLAVTVSTRFAAILGVEAIIGDRPQPVLRPASPAAADTATAAAAFPLVPFGNRVAGNRFTFEGRSYHMAPNAADPCRLHGDGWLADWDVAEASPRRLDLKLIVAASAASPYAYEAHQIVSVETGRLEVMLTVANRGECLPFGLGLHPYFPLTPRMTLEAPAGDYWLEGPGHLPSERTALPADLDFSRARPLPGRWINNGFETWSGLAEIRWPERGFGARLAADDVFRRYMLFQPDAGFDPAWTGDWFAFEPMSHSPAAHRLADLGGLVPLEPNETLAGAVRFEILR